MNDYDDTSEIYQYNDHTFIYEVTSTTAPWITYKDNINTVDVDIQNVGNYAFAYLSAVQTLNIGDSVTTIGDGAFSLMYYITNLTIPDSVTSIGDEAFGYIPSLTSLTIGKNVKTIGDDAFWHMTSLTELTIPDSVTTIGEGAFSGMVSLTSLTIGNNFRSIGNQAFSSMNNLTELTIPDSVTSIGDYAFVSMKSIQSLKIGNNVTTIGKGAFYIISDDAKICCGEKIYSELDNNRDYYGLGDQELSICQSSDDPIDETCKILPSCEELGYVKGYQKECGTDEKNYVLCPYDKEYRKCVNYTCKGLGFTTSDKSSWCAEIVPCKYDSDYTLCKVKATTETNMR